MKPATSEVIDSIISTLNTYIYPEVQSPFAQSVLKTTENLIRHVGLRAEKEVFLLLRDNEDMEKTLDECISCLESDRQASAGLDSDLEALKSTLDSKLTLTADLTMEALQARSCALRGALDDVLQCLNSCDRDQGSVIYQRCRDHIRGYFSNQLRHDAALIDDAFLGARR